MDHASDQAAKQSQLVPDRPDTPDGPDASDTDPMQTGLSQADRDALARMTLLTPLAKPQEHLPDVPPHKIPRHIAVIMDGNGRWARAQGLPHALGHEAGGKTVRRIVEACGRVGVECLTVYAFSSENWKRPREEINALMKLCITYCEQEREALVREGVRVRVIGQTDQLPEPVQQALGELVNATADIVGPTLCLAINYGSRAEITGACRDLAAQVQAGTIAPADIDQARIEACLDTAGLPEIDLMIRTAGEMRLSNFLLWQLSYAELYVTEVLWPDFGVEDFHQAIRAYARRVRRFGARVEEDTPGCAKTGADAKETPVS